jgi:hypothetical protein
MQREVVPIARNTRAQASGKEKYHENSPRGQDGRPRNQKSEHVPFLKESSNFKKYRKKSFIVDSLYLEKVYPTIFTNNDSVRF